MAIVTKNLEPNVHGSVAFVSGGRWYRILQHHCGAATPETGHEPGQGFSREMQIPDARQSRNERSDPRVHDAVSTVAGNKAFGDMRYLSGKLLSDLAGRLKC